MDATYTYGPSGERIAQTKKPGAGSGGGEETSYYGLNPHTDVETLTSETGDARSTYRYTAYGDNDAAGFTGKDKATATGGPEVEAYNPFRFNSKRWDPATSSYDMGFRDYSPGLNRFLTRDTYNGALADLRLGSDPWTSNRYAFTGGNPITGIEYDGHCPMAEEGGCEPGTGPTQPTTSSTATTPAPVDTHGVAALQRDSEYESPVEALQDRMGDQPSQPSTASAGHTALDLCGMFPVVGEPCDLANTAWYASEGDYWSATLSGVAMAPLGGQAATAAKLGKRLDDAADGANSAKNGAATVRVGQVGEAAVGGAFDIGPKVTVAVGGRTRILDGLNDEAVSEVKNVARQSLTLQLRDSLTYAQSTGRRFDLYVRPDTYLTGPLQDAIAVGSINLRFIP